MTFISPIDPAITGTIIAAARVLGFGIPELSMKNIFQSSFSREYQGNAIIRLRTSPIIAGTLVVNIRAGSAVLGG
jgi:hypothetical protein